MTTQISPVFDTFDTLSGAILSRDQRFSSPTRGLAASRDDSRGLRIGILIVAYNAVTTLTKVLGRIPETVWANVEEVVVFDDASKDSTYELAVGYKTIAGLDKLKIMKNRKNQGYG